MSDCGAMASLSLSLSSLSGFLNLTSWQCRAATAALEFYGARVTTRRRRRRRCSPDRDRSVFFSGAGRWPRKSAKNVWGMLSIDIRD